MKRILGFLALEKNTQVLSSRCFLASFGRTVLDVFLPLYFIELGTPVELIGVLYALMPGTGIVTGLIAGYVSDRIGRKPVLIAVGYANSFLIFSYSFAHSWHYLAPLVIIEFNLLTIMEPALLALIAESASHDKKTTAFSTVQTFSFAGALLGPISGGVASQLLGFRVLPYISASLWLGLTVVAHLFLTEKHDRKKVPEKRSPARSLSDLRQALHVGREPFILIVLVAIPLIGRNATGPYEAIYAQDRIHVNKEELGLAYSAYYFAAGLSQVPVGKLADKTGRKKCLVLGFLLYAAATFAFASSFEYYHVVIALALMGVAESSYAAYRVLLSEKASKDRLASMWGVSMATMGACSSLGSFLGGVLWAASPKTPFYFSAALNGMSALLLALAIKESARNSSTSADQATERS